MADTRDLGTGRVWGNPRVAALEFGELFAALGGMTIPSEAGVAAPERVETWWGLPKPENVFRHGKEKVQTTNSRAGRENGSGK